MSQYENKMFKNIKRHDGSNSDSFKHYTCGHCNHAVSGWVVGEYNVAAGHIFWTLCPSCRKPTSFVDNIQYPGVMQSPPIQGLPQLVEDAYTEARQCISVNAFTGCELICRKILMHVAVDKGASEGKSFAFYLDYLQQQGYITPPIKLWADVIRNNGNEATHQIAQPSQERASGTLYFTAELLRIIYEMSHLASKYVPPPINP